MTTGIANHDSESFLKQLSVYRDLTFKVLLERLPKEQAHPLYGLIREQLRRSGKGLRPAFCLATCGAFGGRIEDALDSAAAIELLHNAFLVHDDVEDESEYRHDHPTLHARHGVPIAVNTGDAMQALTMRLLRRNLRSLGPELTWTIFEEFDHMLIQSLEGQAMELAWVRENRCDVSEADYFRMTLKKTCWYSFIHPCRVGALIAQRSKQDLGQLNAFGFYLGISFQIQDDILNLVGSRRKYGKEIGGDLYEGKRTLMLTHLFEHCSGHEKDTLHALLAKPRAMRMAREIRWLYDLLNKYESIVFARSVAQELLGAAEEAFHAAYRGAPASAHKDFIQNSLQFMVRREH